MNRPKRFPWKLFYRIIAIESILIIVALGASGIAARYFFKRQFLEQVKNQLHIALGGYAGNLQGPPDNGQMGSSDEPLKDWCALHSYDPTFRLTLMDLEGRVLCDSHHDPATMENHRDRPEILAALSENFGSSIRFSSTLSENMLYGALLLPKQKLLLRGAIPLENLSSTLNILDTSLGLFLVAMAIALSLFALWSGRKLAFPIGRLLLKAERVVQAGRSPKDSEKEPTHDEVSLDDPQEELGAEPFGELSELETSLEDIRRDLKINADNLSRQQEERATLMTAISDAILAVDLNGTPLFYNEKFTTLFRTTSGEQNQKMRLWELFRQPEILEAFQSVLRQGKPAAINAIELNPGSPSPFYSISISPLCRRSHSNATVYGAIGVFHDVSELKRAEQIRIDFVANVSHELRTPLTAIKGYADTLCQDLTSGRAPSKEFVDVIQRNSLRLMNLINDLLDLSVLESNADQLHKVPIATEEVSRRLLESFAPTCTEKRQSLKLTVKAPLVLADPRRLEQVLINLLDNASKYTPAGGEIHISWTPDDHAGGVVLKVIDTGSGIPQEHLGRLFERFYRVDKARSREVGGTGLGLAIVKHIMLRHGGSVGVESTIGEGSSFICTFPAEIEALEKSP